MVASLILGLITGLHARQALGAKANLLLGTGLCGGMSTFSSLVYATYVLLAGSALSAGVGLAYVGANLVVGFVLVLAGLRVGDVIGARKA